MRTPSSAPRPVPEREEGSNGGTPARSRTRFGLGVGTLLVGWASILAALALLLTETRLSDSRQAARDGNLEAAAQAARDAQTIQPWASEPRLQLALVEEAGGDLRAASASTQEAAHRAPDDYRVWLVAARITAARGDARLARAFLGRAESLTRQPRLIEEQSRAILGQGKGE